MATTTTRCKIYILNEHRSARNESRWCINEHLPFLQTRLTPGFGCLYPQAQFQPLLVCWVTCIMVDVVITLFSLEEEVGGVKWFYFFFLNECFLFLSLAVCCGESGRCVWIPSPWLYLIPSPRREMWWLHMLVFLSVENGFLKCCLKLNKSSMQ